MNKMCFGCGIKLQTENLNEKGFIPPAKFDESKYCQRCYRLIHYGKNIDTNPPKEIKKIINNINKDVKHVLFLTDFLSVNSEVIKIFKSIKAPKTLVISKYDIIPKSVKDGTIRKFIKEYYDLDENIKFVSSHTNYGVEALINYLNAKKHKEAYLVGLSNAGKSNLINKMIDKINPKLNHLTTSNTLNTTLEFIRIPLKEDLLLIDTPGFVIPMVYFKPFTIKGAIKPRIYQMKANESLRIENYYLTFSDDTSVILYIPNEFRVSKYYQDIIFYAGSFQINADEDLVINGLGFIHIKRPCMVQITAINSEVIEVRKSMFGGLK